MNADLWRSDPETAYGEWQRAEATGADRRAFSERSIVQHRSMFARFQRYLTSRGVTVAEFGTDHIDGFFADLDRDCAPGTSTRLRYLKLLDRLSRHLALLGLRADNPAASLLPQEHWPEDEPMPVFLWPDEDARLQELCRVVDFESFKEMRNRAIVAMLLGTGITAAELAAVTVDDLEVGARPSVFVRKRGPRLARRVPVDGFAAELLRAYGKARIGLSVSDGLLFIATAGGKPMKPATLGQCVRAALRLVDAAATDESPRLLRNTYGRRHLLEGKTNEQVSNLLGLSSHRTATRLRETIADPGDDDDQTGATA
ncbi:tyrosine-type recombinase/integrase [Paraburkholderia kirstenboschensis]|uniref:Tyrosine-type recombinase/integrase n=1 Tax=Paraburkholderia kirstenboschensis TaxID=1245436 RepID=A0ABZ0EBZ5_9BURK|nr:tyrosine-type recombinase/integrase [Paraburkholderia kirstenboschensis]WOD14727.1 tyrosine-type recombinase/integrase [Paraburkholderia kirstenboschensis]